MSSATQQPGDGHEKDRIIKGHKYDGIQEYDNPMPKWWTGLFWATIVFSVIYFFGMHVFGVINTYEEDLAETTEDLQAVRAAYAAANPTFQVDEATLAKITSDPAAIERGKVHFAALCAACHGDAGQGVIGPNLTDEYWIHGGSDVEMYDVITDGVVDKGMPGWDSALKPEERAEVVAFIRAVAGTNPAGAKEPQGDLVAASN